MEESLARKLIKWVKFAMDVAYMLRDRREGEEGISIFTIVAVALYSNIHNLPVLALHLLDEDVEDLIGKKKLQRVLLNISTEKLIKELQPVSIKIRRLIDNHTGLRELIEEVWSAEKSGMERWYIAEVMLDNITIYALLISDALEVLQEGGGDVVVVIESISDMRGEVVYRELLLGEKGTIALRGKLLI